MEENNGIAVRKLFDFVKDLRQDQEVLKQYKVYLLIEELKKPQYAALKINNITLRKILTEIISD